MSFATESSDLKRESGSKSAFRGRLSCLSAPSAVAFPTTVRHARRRAAKKIVIKKHVSILVTSVALLLFGAVGCGGTAGVADDTGEPDNDNSNGGAIDVGMAGASPDGYFRILGETMNSIVRDEYPGSSVAYLPGSPAGALSQVATDQAELGVAITPVEQTLADRGEYPFEQSLEGQYQSMMQVNEDQAQASVASAQWAEEEDVQTWGDVAEQQPPMRIAINQTGNVQTVRVAQDYFEQHGFNFEDIEIWGGSVEYVASGEGVSLLRDRRVDVFFNTPGFLPDSDLEEVSRVRDLTWLSMDGENVETVVEEWDLLTGTVTPEDHDFIAREEPTILWPTDLIVSPDMPEDEVYRMTKAILDNRDRIRDIHPVMEDFSAEEAVKSADRVQLHPGAERYYREEDVL